MTSAPVLKLFDSTLPTAIEVDASKTAIGAVLIQQHGDGWHPVAYLSRKNNAAERRYAAHDLELSAIIKALSTWRFYLTDRKVIVLTDHAGLKEFQTQPHISHRQARWLDIIADFDLDIKYRAGKYNVAADALSRRRFEEAVASPAIINSKDDTLRTRLLACLKATHTTTESRIYVHLHLRGPM